MRRILWAVVVLSPFIALAQNYRWSVSSVTNFTNTLIFTASDKIADMVLPLIGGESFNFDHVMRDV